MCGEDIYGNFVSFNASNNLVCLYEIAHVFDEFFNDALTDGITHRRNVLDGSEKPS